MCLGNVPTYTCEKFRWGKSKCRISDVIIYVACHALAQRTTGYVLSIHSNEKAELRSPTKNGLYVFMFISSYSSHHRRRRCRCRCDMRGGFFWQSNFAYFFFRVILKFMSATDINDRSLQKKIAR